MRVIGEARHVSIPFGQVASIEAIQKEIVVIGKPSAKEGGGRQRELRLLVVDDVLDANLVARQLRLHLASARAKNLPD
jgi:hypothetical protein